MSSGITWKVQGWKVMSQRFKMELKFSLESRLGFNGKVSVEGDIEVVLEGTAGNMKRTKMILGRIIDWRDRILFIFVDLTEPHSSIS